MDFTPPPGSARASLESTRAKAENADRAVRELKREVADLTARLERLQGACEAMWFLLKDRLGPEAPELQNLIGEIDRRLDAVEEAEVQACPHCGRTVSQRTGVCIYCARAVS